MFSLKKIFYIVCILLMSASFTCAIEQGQVFNLKTENSYIIPLEKRPLNLQNSNETAVKVEAVTDIISDASTLLVTTKEEGISYISFKQGDSEITIKFLIDNMAEEYTDLLILDKPKDVK